MSNSAYDRWTACMAEMNTLSAQMSVVMNRRIVNPSVIGGQYGLDERVKKYLPLAPAATYVDVGASHPIECSNTWQYYQAGWRGLLIEPYPQSWYQLLRTRTGDVLEPIAAWNDKGMNIMRLQGTVSSFMPDWDIREQASVVVETETLAEILSRHPNIRDTCKLCSIDTEGSEHLVLEGIDWQTFRPNVFVIEYRSYNPTGRGIDKSHLIIPILRTHGYVEAERDDLNAIYIKEETNGNQLA